MSELIKIISVIGLAKLIESTALFVKVIKKHKELKANREVFKTLDTNILDTKKYTKSNSIPPPFLYIFGRDYFNLDISRAALFQRSLDQRDLDHLGKEQRPNNFKFSYMKALTTDNLDIYKTHINFFIRNLQTDIVNNKPIISSYRDHIITLWINLHLYNVNKNDEKIIRKFFRLVINILSIDENSIDNTLDVGYLAKFIQTRYHYFRAYKIFKENIERMKHQIDSDSEYSNRTISYYWMKQDNKLTTEQVITAGIHNVAAFGQFVTVFYSILENNEKYNYLTNYKEAALVNNRIKKYSIIKEIFRLEVPNNFSISWEPNENKQIVHLHKNIMMNADKDYAQFKPNMYTDQTFNVNDIDLITSSVDNETIIENVNSGNIPVVEKPTYCPFGFGYRRCAGENFVYFFMEQLLDTVCNYNIKIIDMAENIDLGIQKQGKDKFLLIEI